MNEVSYSAHISNGKSALNSKGRLSGVAKHNLRKYRSKEYDRENIVLLFGSTNLMRDVKKVYQDIRFSAESPLSGIINVENHFLARDLSDYKLTWALLRNGNPVAEGTLNGFNAKPGETKAAKIPFPAIPADDNADIPPQRQGTRYRRR